MSGLSNIADGLSRHAEKDKLMQRLNAEVRVVDFPALADLHNGPLSTLREAF